MSFGSLKFDSFHPLCFYVTEPGRSIRRTPVWQLLVLWTILPPIIIQRYTCLWSNVTSLTPSTIDGAMFCRSYIKTLNAFLRHSKRYGFCPPDMMTFKQLLKEADQQLFNKLWNNADDYLRSLLPALSTASQHYQLRQRTHNRDRRGDWKRGTRLQGWKTRDWKTRE